MDGEKLMKHLKGLKRVCDIPMDTSISFEEDINISTDAGCVCRPVFVAKRLKHFSKKNFACLRVETIWAWLVTHGLVEYIDKDEEMSSRIAVSFTEFQGNSDYDYVEIHGSLLLSVCASQIPFPQHNQSPRNTYTCSMAKQALSTTHLTSRFRNETTAHNLQHPEKPLVQTKWQKLIPDAFCTGQNVMVAILCQGFNIEDSVVLNQKSVDLGMFRSFHYKQKSAEIQNNEHESFQIPSNNCVGHLSGNYKHLNSEGYANIGSRVKANDVIIGKTVRASTLGSTSGRTPDVEFDASVTFRKAHCEMIVDAVERSRTVDGKHILTVRLREMRTPEIGDKFCSLHGNPNHNPNPTKP